MGCLLECATCSHLVRAADDPPMRRHPHLAPANRARLSACLRPRVLGARTLRMDRRPLREPSAGFLLTSLVTLACPFSPASSHLRVTRGIEVRSFSRSCLIVCLLAVDALHSELRLSAARPGMHRSSFDHGRGPLECFPYNQPSHSARPSFFSSLCSCMATAQWVRSRVGGLCGGSSFAGCALNGSEQVSGWSVTVQKLARAPNPCGTRA